MNRAENRDLELSGPELARLIDAAKDRILAHIASLPRQPSADVAGGIPLALQRQEELSGQHITGSGKSIDAR